MAARKPLRYFCGNAATFIFDMRPYLTTKYRRAGYHVLNSVFAYLPIVYALAGTHPNWLK